MIIAGDALECLRLMPDECAHCCVTSPPYYGLRDYGVDGQIGLEPTPEAYVERMVEVFREVRRVLRSDGTFWLNIGDSYATSAGKGGNVPQTKHPRNDYPGEAPHRAFRAGNLNKNGGNSNRNGVCSVPGCKPKDLIGIPWMLAFALRADGWYLRRDIIWHKPNPMPESVTDRPTSAHEYLFLLTKSARYFYDAEAIKEEAQQRDYATWEERKAAGEPTRRGFDAAMRPGNVNGLAPNGGKRNRRSVWTITPQPFREAHFATFPPALVEPCILAGTSERGVCQKCAAPWERSRKETKNWREDAETAVQSYMTGSGNRTARSSNGGMSKSEYETIGWRPTCSCNAAAVPATVLDPFFGAGTTALVADRLGRDCVGIELNPAYALMAHRRIEAARRPIKGAA